MTAVSGKYEYFNGIPVESGTLLFPADNRAFRYGDGIFETICVRNYQPCFLEDHWNRLVDALVKLSIPIPVNLDLTLLVATITDLLNKNGQHTVRMRLIVYRDAEGYYGPLNAKSSWHLTVSGNIDSVYQVASKGLTADVFDADFKTGGLLSNLKTLNALIYVSAGVEAQKKRVDDLLLKNHKGNLVESINSNLFLRKGKAFMTPPLSEGCLDGVMRKQVIRLLKSYDLRVDEKSVQMQDVMMADELLLTNVVRGAAWIRSFRDKEYEFEYSAMINGWLNAELVV